MFLFSPSLLFLLLLWLRLVLLLEHGLVIGHASLMRKACIFGESFVHFISPHLTDSWFLRAWLREYSRPQPREGDLSSAGLKVLCNLRNRQGPPAKTKDHKSPPQYGAEACQRRTRLLSLRHTKICDRRAPSSYRYLHQLRLGTNELYNFQSVFHCLGFRFLELVRSSWSLATLR